MKKAVILSLFFIFFLQQIRAGETDAGTFFSISYFGETMTHPGVAAGIEKEFFHRSLYSLAWENRVIWYYHLRNHHGIMAESLLSNGIDFSNGLFLDFSGGIGYMGRFVSCPVFSADSGGAVVEKSGLYASRLILSLYLGGGYTFSAESGRPVSVFIRAGFFGEAPYNGYILLHPVIETGVKLNLRPGG